MQSLCVPEPPTATLFINEFCICPFLFVPKSSQVTVFTNQQEQHWLKHKCFVGFNICGHQTFSIIFVSQDDFSYLGQWMYNQSFHTHIVSTFKINQFHRFGRPSGLSRNSGGLWHFFQSCEICFYIKVISLNPCPIYPHCGILIHQ